MEVRGFWMGCVRTYGEEVEEGEVHQVVRHRHELSKRMSEEDALGGVWALTQMRMAISTTLDRIRHEHQRRGGILVYSTGELTLLLRRS